MGIAQDVLSLLSDGKEYTSMELKLKAATDPFWTHNYDTIHKRLSELERRGKVIKSGNKEGITKWKKSPPNTPAYSEPAARKITPLSVGKSPKGAISNFMVVFNQPFKVTLKYSTDVRAVSTVTCDDNIYRCELLALPGGWVLTEFKQVFNG